MDSLNKKIEKSRIYLEVLLTRCGFVELPSQKVLSTCKSVWCLCIFLSLIGCRYPILVRRTQNDGSYSRIGQELEQVCMLLCQKSEEKTSKISEFP
jgi:hypothetical protein